MWSINFSSPMCSLTDLYLQALGIALESARFDIITRVYEHTKDTDILSYVLEAVLDGEFTLAFRNKVRTNLINLPFDVSLSELKLSFLRS